MQNPFCLLFLPEEMGSDGQIAAGAVAVAAGDEVGSVGGEEQGVTHEVIGLAQTADGLTIQEVLFTADSGSNIHSVRSLRNTVGQMELTLMWYLALRSQARQETIRSAPPLEVQ